jgi:alpha-1,2-mannosyltransferase
MGCAGGSAELVPAVASPAAQVTASAAPPATNLWARDGRGFLFAAGMFPNVTWYWSDSSDTCVIYGTVTEVIGFGDRQAAARRSLESGGQFQSFGTTVRRIAITTASPARSRDRLATLAPLLLALSVGARLAWTYLGPNGSNFIDLHVYLDCAGQIPSGGLYACVYRPAVPPISLEFTYPPFAALMFYPLHLLPFGFVGLCWQLGTVAALFASAAVALKMVGRSDWRIAMAWTAIAIWFEPVRHIFELGQINALLMLAVLWAVHSRRWWVSGLFVGWAASMKLTPIVSELYFLGARRWAAAVFSVVVLGATIALSVIVLGEQGRYYFTHLIGDPNRIGAPGGLANQSLRGMLGYFAGRDVGNGPLLVGAVVVAAILALLAWLALDRQDALGQILVVMLFGLLISPISWSHHWVWVLPLIIWLVHGPWRDRTRAIGVAWTVVVTVGVPWLILFAADRAGDRGHWYGWAGAFYVLATLATLVYIVVLGRKSNSPSAGAPKELAANETMSSDNHRP